MSSNQSPFFVFHAVDGRLHEVCLRSLSQAAHLFRWTKESGRLVVIMHESRIISRFVPPTDARVSAGG